jgi:hypothetical protein
MGEETTASVDWCIRCGKRIGWFESWYLGWPVCQECTCAAVQIDEEEDDAITTD